MNRPDKESPVEEWVRHVKRSLRGMMNGPVSASMRSKGQTYKVNFGVELPRLREMAEELPHTFSLATALWTEPIRECRLLAGMLMPAEEFSATDAELWIDSMKETEEAECTSMFLLCRLKDASSKVFEWMASDIELRQLCGFLTVGHLLKQGFRLADRDAQEFLDQVESGLQDSAYRVRRAAQKALFIYMDQGEAESDAGEKLLERLQL
ncbi:MAG: DNA alkylation repair protein [Alloprevotella sp.]